MAEKNLQETLDDFINAGKKYEELHQETVQTLARKLDNISATISQEDKESIKKYAKEGVKEALKESSLRLPTVSQTKPTPAGALQEATLEVKSTRVIHGKLWFWTGMAALVLTAVFWFNHCRKVLAFDGTPESWANRMYAVRLQMYDKNPGAGYHEIMRDFATGKAESAKNKVVRAENEFSELKGHRKKFEKSLSAFLAKTYPTGIRIIEFEEDKQQRYRDGILGKTSDTYEFVYARIVPLDGNAEYSVILERKFRIIDPDNWDVYIIADDCISSIEDYRKNASVVKWNYAQKGALQ